MLRPPSARPELLVDQHPGLVGDGGQFGPPQPAPPILGRSRVIFALPLQDGPRQLTPTRLIKDEGYGFLTDPSGALVSEPNPDPVWVMRMLTATVTWDTRRL